MPTITNFGDVVTQGNTTATGNLTVQGTGTCSFTSASSAVTMAGTLAVTGVTTHSSNIIPSGDFVCGIGTAGARFGNIYAANTNIYTTANIFTANIILANVTNTATFQNSVYHFQNTFSTGYIQTTGVIIPTTTQASGLGGPTLLFANAFLSTANIGSTSAQLSMNVTGNVVISNAVTVTNLFSVTANATYMNVITGGFANMASINVFTGANATFLTVQTLANVYGTANIVTSNTQFANIVTSNIRNLNVSTGANATYLSVQTLANVYGTANIVTSNTQFANIVTSNIRNLNVSTGANATYLSVQTLANVYGTANIVTSNTQFANIVTSNIQNLNVYLSTNTAALTVTGIANIFSANVLTTNVQAANVVTANVQNLNVSTGANATYLSVQTLANVYGTANIFTSNTQFANIVTSNVQNLNVYLSTNTAALTVTGIANIFSANVLTTNVQAANVVTANVQNLNVSAGANITTLFVQTFANILSSNIVSAFHSTMNVSSVANVFTANIYNGNVQTTMNVSGLMSATLYSGNASALMNINASNVTMGILPFRNDGAIGQGATAISINGSVGVNNQYLSSTGTSLQWVGPPAAIFTQVPTSTNQIFYNSGNVAIGVYNWTQFGVGYNTFPGVPLDVYGGSGSFSNVSDAYQTGTIRIMQNAAGWGANGGLEFKTGTNIAGAGHRIVTTEIVSSSGIAPLIFQYRANTPVWSNAMVIHNGTTTPGYVGIGTMAPLFNLHVYQLSNTNPATMTVQMSNTGQSSQMYLSNASGTTTQLYLNGPNLSTDGPANSATLRNNAGDLRLAALGTNPYIYLQTSTSNVGINTSTPTQTLDVQGYARIGSTSADIARLILGRAPGTTNFDYASMIESVSTFATNYQSTLRFYTHGTATTGADPTLAMTINPTQQVGIGIAPSYKFHVDNGATSGINAVVQASTIVAGNTTSMILGKALSTNNSATIVWNHVGEGLATNYLGLGYYGGDNKLCLTASGNVGVGVTNPSDLLHILGTSSPSIRIDAGAAGTTDPRLHFYSGTTFRGRVAYSFSGSYMYYQNDTQDVMRHYNGATGAVVLQPTAGNVGIGNTTPPVKLWVPATSTTTGIGVYNSDVALIIGNAAGGTNAGSIQVRSGGSSSAIGATNYTLALNPDGGNVGIGTASPATRLHVSGGRTRLVAGSETYALGVSFSEASGGFYYIGATNSATPDMVFSQVGGSERMRITNAGNVGIGLASPGYKLDVSGTFNASGDSRVGGNLTINNGSPTITFQDTDSMTAYWHCNSNLMYLLRGGVNAAYGAWSTVNGVWPFIVDLSNNNATFGGNVGIGMGPSYRLDVSGRSYVWGTSLAGGGQNRFTGLDGDGSANGRAQFVLNSSYSDMVISSSQANGTHGSTVSFVANSTANNDYRKFVINVGNWGGYGSGGYGDRMAFGWKDGAYTNPHSYVTPDDSVMCLDGRNKRVGINNIGSPEYTLDVNGNIRARGQVSVFNRMTPYSSTYGTYYSQAAIEVREYNFEGAGGYEMSRSPRIGFHWGGVVASSIAIETSGRIIIATNPGNAYEAFASSSYYCSGSITCAGDVVAYSSDMRLKENIEPITDALNKVKSLSAFTYNFNEIGQKHGLGKERTMGVSAQEVQKVAPEVVKPAPFDHDVGIESKTGENYLTVQYEKLVPLLIAALKEETAKREALEQRMEALEKLIVS